MTAILEKAFGYQGDKMNLPVRDLASADDIDVSQVRIGIGFRF